MVINKKMNITFTLDPNNRSIYYINLEVSPEILEELKQENWVPITPTHLDEYYTKRHRLDDGYGIKGLLVRKVYTFMRSSEFKKTMLDLIWKDMTFQHKWGPRLNYEKINNCTIVEFGFDKDCPGFSTDLHLENRCQIAFGKIFFVPEDAENKSSYFYRTINRDDPLRVPVGMGLGWLCVNTHEGWHEGYNASEEDRYSSSINFTFDIFNNGHVKSDDATIKYIRGEAASI